jgi:2-polyprenyl-3-methyl-5-hydroxy-6-metoxy-1,4-benzoquinol methylase
MDVVNSSGIKCKVEERTMSNLDRDRDIYLSENRYENPKEIFKHLAMLLERRVKIRPGLKICDIGCAAGEFLFHIRSRWKEVDICGFDLTQELVNKARSVLPGENIFVGSVMDATTLAPASQDVIFMNGVHSGINDIETCIANILSWIHPGGTIYIFGIFNPYPIDMQITYTLSDKKTDPILFYIYSCKTISKYIKNIPSVKNFKFEKYVPQIDIKYREKNPFRAWTTTDQNGNRILVNGLSMIVNCFILEIKV